MLDKRLRTPPARARASNGKITENNGSTMLGLGHGCGEMPGYPTCGDLL